jgi:DNA-binding NarL/FixJ family response regulator
MTTLHPATPAVSRLYRLRCGIPALAIEIARGLQQLGWERNEQGDAGLLIDAPSGFALQELAHADPGNWVVVTDNLCPEYWEDLWACSPRGLLAGGHSAQSVTEALSRIRSSGAFRHTPQHTSPLTCVERRLLRHSAQGWENKRIAQELALSEGTVRNGLSRVFQKLGFENRTQVALYYWGLWHLLDKHLL